MSEAIRNWLHQTNGDPQLADRRVEVTPWQQDGYRFTAYVGDLPYIRTGGTWAECVEFLDKKLRLA